jgi:hypothetical protein
MAWVQMKREARGGGGPYPKLNGGWTLAVKSDGGEFIRSVVWCRREVAVMVPRRQAWVPQLWCTHLVLNARSKWVETASFGVATGGQFTVVEEKENRATCRSFYSPVR